MDTDDGFDGDGGGGGDDGGFADGGDYGGGGGGGGDSGDDGLPGVIDAGGYDLPPGATNNTPDPSQVMNTPIPSGSPPPNIAPSNPTLTGPWISVGGGVSVQPGIYGSPTNPKGVGIGGKVSF